MDQPAETTRSISFQENFEDLVAVSLLLSQKMYRKQKIRHALYAAYVLVFGLLVAGTWWRKGYHEPAGVVAGMALIYAGFIGYFLLRFNYFAKRKMHAHLAQFKNIGLAVPSTITLHEGYLETNSALASGRLTWDIIEAIRREGGYLIFQVGPLGHFVPDRAFETTQDADAFTEHALRLIEAARARTPDLRESPHWGD